MPLDLENIQFDHDKISAADIEDFKEVAGVDLQTFVNSVERGEINEGNFMEHLTPLTAFVWIAVRQSQPDVEYEEVRRTPLLQLLNGLNVSTPDRQPAANGTSQRRVANPNKQGAKSRQSSAQKSSRKKASTKSG